jgi:A/G-specific adenine glycosylase
MDWENKLEQAVVPLLQWYNESARSLPWREDHSPYRVWVSEIMLQQTRVAAVIDYFQRFMTALPTVADLAQVPEDTLLKLWQGLGYYNRARNLKKAAQIIVADFGGEMPADYEKIVSLPGIGDYTAGAIASIAYGIPVPAVDGNVLRVVSRILGDARDISQVSTKKAVRELLQAVMPKDAPGAFNQSLMELGALVCLPNGAPLCVQCPVREMCTAYRDGRTDELPVKAAKKARRIEERTVWLIFCGNYVALRRRANKGLLAGLWEFPNELTDSIEGIEQWHIESESQAFAGAGKHIFTHIEWHMRAIQVETKQTTLPEGWVWASREELERDYAVPNAFQSFLPIVEKRMGRTTQ